MMGRREREVRPGKKSGPSAADVKLLEDGGFDDLSVLVVPMYSKQELNADSNYVVYTEWVRAMSKRHPGWSFIIPFPDAKSGYKYDDDGFFDMPNVLRVPQRISPRKLANAVSYDGMFYDMLFRKYAFDVVWCNLVEVAGNIQHAGDSTYEQAGKPLVVAAHNYVIHETLPYSMIGLENVLVQQLHGALLADVNVFNSDHCQRMLMDNARKYLSGAGVERIDRSAVRIDYGTLEDSLKPVRSGNKVPVIAYNHRLQAYKNFRETFALLEELYNEGVKFTLRYMNNTTEATAKIRRYPFVEICLCKNRDEYLRKLRGCDLNVTNSQHETFCIAAIESMALGQPFVAPDGVTFPQIVGKEKTGYPYLFNSREEQKDYLRLLLTDEKERRKWGLKLSKFVRGAFNSQLWAQRYSDMFKFHYMAHVPTSRSLWAVEQALQIGMARRADVHTVKVILNSGKILDDRGRQPLSNQSCTLPKLLKMIRMAGARVNLTNGKQEVVWR